MKKQKDAYKCRRLFLGVLALLMLVANSVLIRPLLAKESVMFTVDDEKIVFEEVVAAPRVVLLAWTTWCPYCRKELLRLDNDAKEYGSIKFFLVNVGESPAKVNKFITGLKLKNFSSSNSFIDKGGVIGNEFSINAVPVYLFFKDGKFQQKSHYINDEIIREIFGEK